MPRRIPPRRNDWDDDDDPDGEIAVQTAWTPTPKQAEYLAASEFEVLYGGAAGGGKTDALVIDAMGLWQNAILHSDYKAIIFRPMRGLACEEAALAAGHGERMRDAQIRWRMINDRRTYLVRFLLDSGRKFGNIISAHSRYAVLVEHFFDPAFQFVAASAFIK